VSEQANDDDAVAWRRNDVGGARKMEAVGHWARSLRGDFGSHKMTAKKMQSEDSMSSRTHYLAGGPDEQWRRPRKLAQGKRGRAEREKRTLKAAGSREQIYVVDDKIIFCVLACFVSKEVESQKCTVESHTARPHEICYNNFF
jgi:hypothetical protein